MTALTAFLALPIIRGYAAAMQPLTAMARQGWHYLQRMKNRKGFKAKSSKIEHPPLRGGGGRVRHRVHPYT
jgi:hypothetical protein